MSDAERELRAEIARLNKIVEVLMNRAERSTNLHGTEFSWFQSGLMLEEEVQVRTRELEAALHEIERINRALRESEAKYRGVVDQSLVGIAIIEDGRFTFTNWRFDEIFGYGAEELRQLGPLDLAIEEERPLVAEQVAKRVSGELERVHYQLRGRRKDGEQVDIEIHGNTGDLGGRRLLISVVQDVSERIRAEREMKGLQEKLREQSLRDALTNLYNRRYLEEALGRELLLGERNGMPVSVIMSDIDYFKRVNDRYGHQVGDEVLRAFARWLAERARGSDIGCRFGGEEFLLVLPGMKMGEAIKRAEQLRRFVADTPIPFGASFVSITASFGVASFPSDGRISTDLIAAADRALYSAKAAGRNRVMAAGSSSEPG